MQSMEVEKLKVFIAVRVLPYLLHAPQQLIDETMALLAPDDLELLEEPLTHLDAVSTVPEMKGDWVLFHPVYTNEEIKAVQVGLHAYLLCIQLTSGRRSFIERRRLLVTNSLVFL